MENKKEFYKINTLEKLIFKLSIITICAIVGNLMTVLLHVFYGESFILPKFWIVANTIVIIVIGGTLINKLKLKYQVILIVGLFCFFLLPVFWQLLPVKFTQEYVGLRLTDEEGFVASDVFCIKDCNATKSLINQGYYEERKFYSWRYAELLGRNPINDKCCSNQPFNSKYFFGILLILEMTFEYLPIILILSLLLSTFEYYKRKDFDAFGSDFIELDEFDIRKVNVYGLFIIVIILLYNIVFINSF